MSQTLTRAPHRAARAVPAPTAARAGGRSTLLAIDGVLLDTCALTTALLRHLFPHASPGRIACAIGSPTRAVIADLSGRLPDHPSVPRMAETFRRRLFEAAAPRAAELVVPQAELILQALQGSGATVLLPEDPDTDLARELAHAAGLRLYAHTGPRPERAGIAMVIGDRPAHVRTARSAGSTFLGAGYGTCGAQRLRDADARHIAQHPSDLAALIDTHHR